MVLKFLFCSPRQYDKTCWKFDPFLGFVVSSWLIVWSDGIMNVAGVLQDTGDADSRAAPDPNHKLNISSFPTCPHPLDS